MVLSKGEVRGCATNSPEEGGCGNHPGLHGPDRGPGCSSRRALARPPHHEEIGQSAMHSQYGAAATPCLSPHPEEA